MTAGSASAVLIVGLLLMTLTAVVTWSLVRRAPEAPDVPPTPAPPPVPPAPRDAGEDPPGLLGGLEAAVDAIDLGLVVCDERGRIVFRNRVAHDLAEARHGRALVEAALEELLAAALEGRPGRREVDLFGPPNEAFSVRAVPLDAEAGGGALAVVENTTDRKRIETVRRDFVANISHELKTPIGAIGLLAETLLGEDDPATLRRLLARMVSEAERAADTVDDLLELSRIELGDDTEFAPVDVSLAVHEALARVTGMADHRGVPVQVRVPTGLMVSGDRRQIVSAVFNLVDNAVKFSPEGAPVRVDAGRVDGHLEVRVVDHGPGIPTRDLGRVFERFYRVDPARSRDTGGTGLGLAIVRHVASNHGGDVRVESVEGVGSTFTLLLPAHDDGRRPA